MFVFWTHGVDDEQLLVFVCLFHLILLPYFIQPDGLSVYVADGNGELHSSSDFTLKFGFPLVTSSKSPSFSQLQGLNLDVVCTGQFDSASELAIATQSL